MATDTMGIETSIDWKRIRHLFALFFFIVVAVIMVPFGNIALANGISAGWVSIANIWMFAGLLAMSGKAENAAGQIDFRQDRAS